MEDNLYGENVSNLKADGLISHAAPTSRLRDLSNLANYAAFIGDK